MKASFTLVEQMLSTSTSPADPAPVGAMTPAATQLDELLSRTWEAERGNVKDVLSAKSRAESSHGHLIP